MSNFWGAYQKTIRAVLFHNCGQDKPGIVIFVGAGGEGQNPVGKGGGDAAEHGTGNGILKPLGIVFVGRKVCAPGITADIRYIAGEEGQRVSPFGCEQIPGRMGIIKGLAFEVDQISEHGAVPHVVAVNDGILIRKIPFVAEIHENTAGAVVASVDQMI